MNLEIFWSDRLKISRCGEVKDFLQKIANRFMQGHCRYGEPDKSKRYMTRIGLEYKAYKKTGNAEHLYNIAVYCGLELQAPEHKKFHFDNTVDSVTRGKI